MSFLKKLFTRQQATASLAKERLQIVVSHQSQAASPTVLKHLHTEILEVIRKYFPIDPEQIRVDLDTTAEGSTLELNVSLPNNIESQLTKTPEQEAESA